MAMNKAILEKVTQKTKDNKNMRDFITESLFFESSGEVGWFTKEYKELLDKYVKDGKSNENH